MPTSPASSPPCKPRFATPATDRPDQALGVAKVATLLGYDLMAWQHFVNGLGTEQTPAGRFAYRQVVLEVMRQQGKTVDLLPMMIARALRRPGTQISYTAQTRLDARHRLLDVWWPMIERSKLSRFIEVRRGSGSEAYMFRNGSMLGLVSGTQTSGHGDSLDLGVIDEAWAQEDDHIEQAMRPAMMTRDAQLWVVSAAGTEKSTYFRAKVEDGRARAEMGVTEDGCYVGYSAADDADPGDPATWRACMPALGITVSEETVMTDFKLMDLAEFRRAYLCQWPEVAKPGWDVIGEDTWGAAAVPGGRLLEVQPDVTGHSFPRRLERLPSGMGRCPHGCAEQDGAFPAPADVAQQILLRHGRLAQLRVLPALAVAVDLHTGRLRQR